jgi:branched-chain amino acid transport system substrate-binding protein
LEHPRGFRLALVIGATALFVGACGAGPAPSPSASAGASPAGTPSATAAGEIVLGGVGPLSQPGDVAIGTEMKWAMEQAVADLNAKGGVLGRQLRLEFNDTQNQPDVCASVAQKLVDENVAAVVGEAHSGCGLAQIPAYNKGGMPVVFSETYNDKITAGDPADPNLPANPPTIFRIAPTSTYYSSFVADWLINGLKAKKLVHIVDNSDYGNGEKSAMQAALAGSGIKLVQVAIDTGQADYSAIVSRAKAENPDADAVFFDSASTADGWTLQQNAIDAGLVDTAACIGGPGATDFAGYWRAVPGGVGCAFQQVGLTSSQFNAQAKSLDDRANQALGHGARNYAFEAYDSVLLVADAITRAGSTDHQAIVKALETTSMTGAQGQYSFPYNSANPVPSDKPAWLWHQWPEPPIQLLEYTKKDQTLADASTIWPASRQTVPGQAWVPVQR